MTQTALELKFADGDYLFDLKLPQMKELQDKRGVGIFAIYGRVLKGRYLLADQTVAISGEGQSFVEDLFETIRLGLIGGGRGMVDGEEVEVSALRARDLVEAYCLPAPLKETWNIAAAILGARIEGYEPPKKAVPPREGAGETTSTSGVSPETAPSSE